jgi:hypothetical protein
MSVWIDTKYLKQIAPRLEGWTERHISPHQSVCRCPICGDSQKKKSKKRGYFYEHDNSLMYKCFNCAAALPFGKFLKDFDAFIYKHYALENYKTKVTDEKEEDPDFKVGIEKTLSAAVEQSYLDGTVLVMSLPDDHKAKRYLQSRLIPEEYLSLFHYTPSFFKWAGTNTDKFNEIELSGFKDHARIIMPWHNKDGYMFAYQGRSLNGEEPKYYTIILKDKYPKFFGLDRLDSNKKIYCVEGPIDSLFLPNAVAVGSSALTTFDDNLKNVVYCFDNERRNPDITKLIGRAVKHGKKVFIPPNTYNYKDLNEAFQSGLTKEEVKDIIDSNTFIGPAALMKFNMWKRS